METERVRRGFEAEDGHQTKLFDITYKAPEPYGFTKERRCGHLVFETVAQRSTQEPSRGWL